MGVVPLRMRAALLNRGGGSNVLEQGVFSPQPAIDPSAYYTPGVGNPAVSTSDAYGLNGLHGWRPYDLDAYGAAGATIKTREGKRYLWLAAPDHPFGVNFQGSSDFKVGYSDDPEVYPAALFPIFRFNQTFTTGGQTNFSPYHAPQLVYNPDTYSNGDVFGIYCEGLSTSSSRQHEMALFTTDDFLTSQFLCIAIPTTNNNGWTSLGKIFRRSTGVWEAVTFGTPASATSFYLYTSTDGETWVISTQLTPTTFIVNGSLMDRTMPGEHITYNSQAYEICREQTNGNVQPSLSYITMVPIDAGFNLLSSPASIRLSAAYNNVYPGPYFLQQIGHYEEDGISHIHATRGFVTSGDSYDTPNGGPDGLIYSQGGGLWQQFADRYGFVFDATAAAGSAPCGVKISCAAGVVSLNWDNVGPNTYRLYKGTSAGSQATLVGDITGTSTTHSPTADQRWWFKLVRLAAGVEQKSRVVDTYVSAGTLMVNAHVTRVMQDGGDDTKINLTKLAAADALLTSNNWWRYLLHWADPSFGVKESGGKVIKVYCLGTTRLPGRSGDYTPTTSNTFPSTSSNTTYSATGISSTTPLPAWVNGANTARGYFGSGVINNIQRKTEITVIAVYQKPSTNKVTLLSTGENAGMNLVHESGTPGSITFEMSPSPEAPSSFVTATATVTGAATDPTIAAGTFDGTNITAYYNGNAGTPVDGSTLANPTLVNASVLKGLYRGTSTNVPFLGCGSEGSKINQTTGAYTFNASEALESGAARIVFEKVAAGMVSTITSQYQTWMA